MPDRTLTTTGYAILGVLAIKPRTAYELAVEMRHCFEYFWPRDDVRVYSDAKELAARGLATSERVMVGRRPRTTYSITPAGKRALKKWLAQPSRPVAMEFEGLIKVYLARFGTLEQLRDTVRQVSRDAEYMLNVATNVRDVYLQKCAPFQDDYVHVWFFVYDFLSSYFRMLGDWAARTEAEMAGWDDLTPDAKRDRALALFDRKVPDGNLTADWGRIVDGVPAMPGQWRKRQPA
ncbi:MAG TPA: PadR family transcriptional regulator [Candidatus Dormibacteraeota bacterium]